jgi:hypothetical protein
MIDSGKTNMTKRECEFIAMLMAANCVRNTAIKSYHARGKITDQEMMAFSKQVVNRLYTFLTFYFGKTDEASRAAFLNLAAQYYPADWALPELDAAFMAALKEALAKGSEASVQIQSDPDNSASWVKKS